MSVSRKEIVIFEVLHSSLYESCFVFNSSNFKISCSLLPVHIKNISSIDFKKINESPCKKGF